MKPVRRQNRKKKLLRPALPSPPGSCPSPGCWCRGRVSQSSRWGRPRLPGRPDGRHETCNTELRFPMTDSLKPPAGEFPRSLKCLFRFAPLTVWVQSVCIPGVAQTQLQSPLHPPCSSGGQSSSSSSLSSWRRHGNRLHCWTSRDRKQLRERKQAVNPMSAGEVNLNCHNNRRRPLKII